MSNPISEAAVSSRESHRDRDGRFGAQPASEADVDLSGPPPAEQTVTTRKRTIRVVTMDTVLERVQEPDWSIPAEDGSVYQARGSVTEIRRPGPAPAPGDVYCLVEYEDLDPSPYSSPQARRWNVLTAAPAPT